MTVQRFQRPVMAQLLQADFVRRHLGDPAVVREALIWWGGVSDIVTVDGLSIQVMASNFECTQSLACGGCHEAKHCR